MRRIALATFVACLTVAGSAMAMTNPNSVNGTRPSAVPEPGAALLFAAGLGSELFAGYYDNTDVAWKIFSVMGLKAKEPVRVN